MKHFEGIVVFILAMLIIYGLFLRYSQERECNAHGGVMVKQQFSTVCVYRDFYEK